MGIWGYGFSLEKTFMLTLWENCETAKNDVKCLDGYRYVKNAKYGMVLP